MAFFFIGKKKQPRLGCAGCMFILMLNAILAVKFYNADLERPPGSQILESLLSLLALATALFLFLNIIIGFDPSSWATFLVHVLGVENAVDHLKTHGVTLDHQWITPGSPPLNPPPTPPLQCFFVVCLCVTHNARM
jgi:hypothetical protein